MNNTRWTGASLALASAALFGISTPLAKSLLGEIGPQMLAGLLYLGSGLGLLAFIQMGRVTGRKVVETPLRRADFPWLAGAVLTGGVAGPLLLMNGLSTTPAASSALLLNLEGLATMAIAWMVFRENAGPRILLGASAILAGAVVLSWEAGALNFGTGAFAIAAACLAWGVDNNVTRKISGADPVQITAIKGLVAGTVNLGVAMALGAKLPQPATILTAGVLGLIGYGVSLVLFVLALRHVGAARTGAYFSAAPFIGATASLLLLTETVTVQLAAAAFLMGVGVYLHLTERHEHVHTHEPLEHEHIHVHDLHHQHSHDIDDPPGEPHAHIHRHVPLTHRHAHFPDLHHEHQHKRR